MTGILKVGPEEQIRMYQKSSNANSKQIEIIDNNGYPKTITIRPSVWEYNNIFLLVAKYNQGVCGVLTLNVIGVSRIFPI